MAVAEDKLNTLAIVTIGIASVLLLWASIVALQAYYATTFGDATSQVNAEGRGAELRTLRAEQQASLQALRRNDDGETVRIPIERAQQLVVSELRTGAPESLVPAVGPHDAPTVPAVWGRPPDDARAADGQDEDAEDEDADEDAQGGDELEGEDAEAADGEVAAEETGDTEPGAADRAGADRAAEADGD